MEQFAKYFFLLHLYLCIIIHPVQANDYAKGDSIMQTVMKSAETLQHHLHEYEGSAYIKATTIILHTNGLQKWMPWAFPFGLSNSSKGKFFEMWGIIEYKSPNQFIYKPQYIRQTSSDAYSLLAEAMPLLNVNIYADASFDDKFIMPGSLQSKGLYQYRLDDIIQKNGHTYYKIKFTPIRKSLRVINGYIYVLKGTQLVQKIEAWGQLDIASFKLETTFNDYDEGFMLPKKSTIDISYNILKNISTTHYECVYQIDDFTINKSNTKAKNRNHDLTNFKLPDQKLSYEIKNNDFWDAIRPEPLGSYEAQLIESKRIADSIKIEALKVKEQKIDYLKLSESLVSNSTRIIKKSKLKYSGVLNPGLVGYSKTNGIVLRQRLYLFHTFKNETDIEVMPEVGFGFKSHELFYGLRTTFLYKPARMGRLEFQFQKGNNSFGARFIESIEQNLDSANLNFDDLDIHYYRDYRFRIENTQEITNGLLLNFGVDYTLHRPIKKTDLQNQWIENDYADFAPFARLTWTPHQYYRYIGKRKYYLDSPYPTLAIEYAQGINGIMRSNSRFKRIELDMHHRVKLTKLRSFNYRFGAGMFYDQKSEYFVDYRFFKRRTYPDSWDERVGGVFNLLDSQWYYASNRYVQLHLMYDSPYILLHFFKRISRYLLSERLYISQLYTPIRPCYTELGYGIGNYIINAGFFVSFNKGKYYEMGGKVSFVLGRYW